MMSLGFPGVFYPSLFLEENQKVFHPIDLAEMPDMDTPGPGVILAHCEEVFGYLMHG